MTPMREWLKPPRGLLLALFGLTAAAVSALGWFGWRLVQQERIVEAQRDSEALEQAADRVAASVARSLAEAGDRLSAWATAPPSDGKPEQGILLVSDERGVSAWPRGRVLYYPVGGSDPGAADAAFREGEALEFAPGGESGAAEWYRRRLATAGDAATHGGAGKVGARAAKTRK